MERLLKMLFGGLFLAYFVYSVFSGGILNAVVFGIICLVFFAIVWVWEAIERKIKKRRMEKSNEKNR